MDGRLTPHRSIRALTLLALMALPASMRAQGMETPEMASSSALAVASVGQGAPEVHEVGEPMDESVLPDAPIPPMPAGTTLTLPGQAPTLPPCPRKMQPDTPRCLVNPFQRFLDGPTPVPLTPGQKGYLALHNFMDPANIITITGIAAITVGFNADTAYGPGLKGFGWDTAYSFSQDATGEFFGTFLIPSLAHEDPHYHREPHAPVARRLVHALSRTLIAQSDTGRNMPNYAVLLTYPISAEASNLYVPGIAGNGPSTVKRIATGLATDPVNNLITEFLPDVARRVNIRVIFVQRVVNMMTAGNMAEGPP